MMQEDVKSDAKHTGENQEENQEERNEEDFSKLSVFTPTSFAHFFCSLHSALECLSTVSVLSLHCLYCSSCPVKSRRETHLMRRPFRLWKKLLVDTFVRTWE